MIMVAYGHLEYNFVRNFQKLFCYHGILVSYCQDGTGSMSKQVWVIRKITNCFSAEQ